MLGLSFLVFNAIVYFHNLYDTEVDGKVIMNMVRLEGGKHMWEPTTMLAS
jgi:hypothetical protein